jgi:small subunit ribosomal protein S7
MSRKGHTAKRKILPDPKFNDKLIAKFINKVMLKGKKSTAEQIVYGSLGKVQDQIKDDALKIFKKALDNIKPVVEVRSRRVGGATYQVPVEVRPERRVSLGLRWLVDYARSRGERTMADRLAGEIMDAFQGRGEAVKKKDDVHRMAEANKAFSHYRW